VRLSEPTPSKTLKPKEKRRLFLPLLVFPLLLFLTLWGFEQLLDCWVPFDTRDPYGVSRQVLSNEGVLLRLTPTQQGERRIVLPLSDFSSNLVDALIVAEDKSFASHGGVDFLALGRALISNLRAQRRVSGASTISMQVCRLLEPRPRNFHSKLLEIFRTRQLERLWSKEKILAYYLNTAPLGGTLRGFEAASLYWFGVHARVLDPMQAATLVALLPAPSFRSPRRNPQKLLLARNQILTKMVEEGAIQEEDAVDFKSRPLGTRVHPWPFKAPHATQWFLSHMEGSLLKTSLRWSIQQGVRGLAKRFDPGPGLGLGVLVLDRKGGDVLAMMGSPDWKRTQVNALFSPRCVGSTLKPFLYALALDLGVGSTARALPDRPQSYGTWSPKNFDRNYLSWVGFSDALRSSRNLPAVVLLQRVGCARFRDLLVQLGLPVPEEQLLGLDVALGTLSLTPFQLAQAYRLFWDEDQALSTSVGARRTILEILKRPQKPGLPLRPMVAWKTGTSSGRRDAWSVGLTKNFVLLVWMGPLIGAGSPECVGGGLPTDLLFELASLVGE
jgi:penicillin-binding protein 1C